MFMAILFEALKVEKMRSYRYFWIRSRVVWVTATKRGGGVIATKKKDFFKALKKIPQKNVATKIERGGVGKALVAGPLKK